MSREDQTSTVKGDRSKERRVPAEGTGVPRAPRKVSDDKGGTNDGLQVISYIISGLLLYGGLGWLGDWLLDTSFLFPVGLVLGVGLATYMIIKRFGQSKDAQKVTLGRSDRWDR